RAGRGRRARSASCATKSSTTARSSITRATGWWSCSPLSRTSRSAPVSPGSCCALLRKREERQVVRQVDLAELGELVAPAGRLGERRLLRRREPGLEVILTRLADQRGADRGANGAERERRDRLRRPERSDL